MNRLQAAWQVFKGWGGVSPSQSLLQILQGAYARDGEMDALEDVVRVTTLYRAVNRIAYDLAGAPLLIERKRGARWVALEEDSREFGGVARVFKQANPHEGRTALWVRFHQSAELVGRTFLLTDYENGGVPPRPSQPPKSLRVLRADAVDVALDERTGIPATYRYTGDRGRVQVLRPDEILDHRYPHPREDWAGLSPARAVQMYTKIEDELAAYQRNFIRQGARGSVLLSSDQMVLTTQQVEQIRAEWGTSNGGVRNVGGVWVTGKGLKATELNGRRDTDFVDLFRIVKEQVSAATGVPPVFLGDYANAALANIEEQTPIYVEGTLMAKGALLEENLTELVLPRFEPQGTLRARYAWDRVPMVQRMSLKRMISFATIVDKVMTREEVRVALNMEPEPEVGEFREAPDPFALGVPPLPTEKPRPAAEPKRPRRLPVTKWIDDPVRNEKRLRRAASVRALEKVGERAMKAYFTGLQERVLDALPAVFGKAHGTKATVDDFFDEDVEIQEVEGVLVELYTSVSSVRGQDAMRQAGFDPASFDINDPRVQQFIADNAYRNGRRIVGTTAEKLREVLAETAADGRSLQQLTDDLRDLFALRRSDAATIARTETIRAYNASSVEAWTQTGVVERVEWLTAHDDAVRDSHAEIDGESIELGGTFSNGLSFPGDPSGPAEETINCRCTLDPKTEDDAKSGARVARGLVERLLAASTLTRSETGKYPASMNGKEAAHA